MKAGSVKSVRCAIYTRVSDDQGLDQDFNSLDAQYEASQAYIRSQAYAGWTMLRAKYDDGGFSGGNTERPALQRLLDDVRAGRIEIIVVYKVDRLTRSLADFAKLVELFDQKKVSFVSVTQQFNTTTSMGRLTLNVLLSFAQFEREVTSERIRDKIAASKRKGLWVGGMAPLGYDTKDRKITVNMREAARVRLIFQQYLELGSLNLLMGDLRKRGVVTKQRKLKDGSIVGGIPFTRGPLAHLLHNRFYIGEVTFKGDILPGEQPAIIDRKLFEAVQARLSQQVTNFKTTRIASSALLTGKLYDDRSHRMGPSHVRKSGKKYRYYLSSALVQGQAENAGSVSRIPAEAVEGVVVKSLRDHLELTDPIDDRALIDTYVHRIDVEPEQLSLTLAQPATPGRRQPRRPQVLRIPWRKPPSRLRRELLRPATPQHQTRRPIRAETRAILVAAIARGRQWLNELLSDPTTTIDLIAAREHCTQRKINMTISLAFLAPDPSRPRLTADSRTAWASHGSPICRPSGIGNIRRSAWRPPESFGITPPNSTKATSAQVAIGETGICRQRIMPQKPAHRSTSTRRNYPDPRKARQWRAFASS